LRIETFKPEHLLGMLPREPERTMALTVPDYVATAKLYAEHGPAFTGFVSGIPIAVAGIMLPWPGLGTAWAFTTSLVAQFPCAFHRTVKRKIEEIALENGLRRLQMDVPESHTVSRRWALRLGFRKECAMPSFGPANDTWMRYVRLF
jgi:hypothetical protein